MARRGVASALGDLRIGSDVGLPVVAEPVQRSLSRLSILDLRSYASLEAEFGSGPQLVWGPNAAGKTSLLEAIVLLAWGRSHRTSTDAELIRWGSDLARVEGSIDSRFGGLSADPRDDPVTVDVVLARPGGPAGRKRIRVNGVPRRSSALLGLLRIVIFAPEEMLLVAGSPAVRRAALDGLAGQRSAAYLRDLATYARALQQRNSLLR